MTEPKAPGKPPALPAHENPTMPPEVFGGKYLLVRQLGSDGADTLHEAENVTLGKRVSMLLLRPSVGQDPKLRERFFTNARAAAQLDHPNLADIYDFGLTTDGTPFLVTEWLVGKTIREILDQRGAIPPATACEFLLQALNELAKAHRAGVVHGDLTPARIVVTYPGSGSPLVKVTGLGVVRSDLTRGADSISAPHYLAPEQVRGGVTDARVDLYAIGAILYELLAGEPPFLGPAAEVVRKIMAGQWKPLANINPAVPPLLARTVAAALATDPAKRLQSAHEFAGRITPYVSEPPPASSAEEGRLADALLLRAASGVAEIRVMSPSRPPRDFPSKQLAKVAGKPRGEALADSLLQSPIIPKAPGAPKIQVFSGSRDLERWSDLPSAFPEPGDPPKAESDEAHGGDPLFDDRPRGERRRDERSSLPAPWRRTAWAAAFGVGLGAILAWLYRLG